MKLLWYGVVVVLAVALGAASIGWYLAAHPGGTRFASCRWQGNQLVLGYSYGTGDQVTTMVSPKSDHVVAQLRVQEKGGDKNAPLIGQTRIRVTGGPMPVEYPSGAALACMTG